MKIIDVHAHYFPDNISEQAVRRLQESTKEEVKAYGHNLASLKKCMQEDGVAVSINQPVATKAEQVKGINRRMIEHNNKGDRSVICFGAMHPDFGNFGDMDEELAFLAKSGIKGIKLHPDYMGVYPDDGRMMKIYEGCAKNNLAVLSHAGIDIAYREIHSSPKHFAAALGIKGLKLILAHMGGYRMWDEVMKCLVGKDVYFDTAYTVEMDDELMRRIIFNHGHEKILFGTDFPWERAANIEKKLDRLITGEVKEMIYHKNAERLLGL